MERTILLVAAGHSRVKKMFSPERGPEWNGQLLTVDTNPTCPVDVVHDMGKFPFPFGDESFDEIHAYDCLEHWGTQGDWRGWFDEMSEYHRILKPDGEMSILVPIGEERFGDPGHTRLISINHFLFLNQRWYEGEIKAKSPATDYRYYWKKNFEILRAQTAGEPAHHLGVVLQKSDGSDFLFPVE